MKKKVFLLAAVLLGTTCPALASPYSTVSQDSTAVSVPGNGNALTITVNQAGTLANLLVEEIEQWTDVTELTVVGALNANDMGYFSRLTQLRRLDLSQTDITFIGGCTGLSSLEEVVLPTTVQTVKARAFHGCSKLKSINLPNATEIGYDAFSHCSALTSISLPNATEIGYYAFLHCSALTSISLPNATEIGYYAFLQCSALTSIQLPNATEIGDEAFYYCSSLKSVQLSEELTEIPTYCFGECKSLKEINFPSKLKTIRNYAFYNTSLSSVTLPEGLIEVKSYAFDDSPITQLTIPSTVTSFGASDLPSLTDVYCHAVMPPSASPTWSSSATLHVPAVSVAAYRLDDSWYGFGATEALEGETDKLNIGGDFALMNYTGLADKAALNLNYGGHLTVSAGSTLSLGTFAQQQLGRTSYYYDDTYYVSTLLTDNAIEAEHVSLQLAVGTGSWYFISVPFDVNVSDITCPESTLWVIRKYSGADRAALTGNTWQNMPSGTTLQGGEGYILHCAHDSLSTVEFTFPAVDNARKNSLFACNDVVKPLSTYTSEFAHNRSWNLVGNPYPTYFDTQYIEHNGVITVYNTGTGNYEAYSLTDDHYVLRPNEAFFVQCPSDATGMTFKAEGRSHTATVATNSTYSSPTTLGADSRTVYNFTLRSGDLSDRTRLVINPEAAPDYEISCDASKFLSDDPTLPQLYVYDNGIRYAIDERPLGNGTVGLGARFGATGDYTLQLSNSLKSDTPVLLTDHETGQVADLNEGAYSFSAQSGTSDSRFTLTIGGQVTGISETPLAPTDGESIVYDLQGRIIEKAHPQKGIYIIRQNGKSHKVLK